MYQLLLHVFYMYLFIPIHPGVYSDVFDGDFNVGQNVHCIDSTGDVSIKFCCYHDNASCIKMPLTGGKYY